ncbi:MFS transporter, partial [Escherichia coli]|nr:MFS transporter [Escherichia coli]
MSALKTSALRLIKPFAYRDYALLASALVFSTFAAGMWAVAMVYQVRRLGGGPMELSAVATASAAGLLCFVLLGGIMADRHSCRRIVMLVEALSLAVMGVTALLAITEVLQLWHLI